MGCSGPTGEAGEAAGGPETGQQSPWGGGVLLSPKGLIIPPGLVEGFSFPLLLCSLTQKAERGIF